MKLSERLEAYTKSCNILRESPILAKWHIREIEELERKAAAFERWGDWLYGVEWQNIKLKWLDSVPEAYK